MDIKSKSSIKLINDFIMNNRLNKVERLNIFNIAKVSRNINDLIDNWAWEMC